jgi:hypothetical protein
LQKETRGWKAVSTAREGEHKRRVRTVKLALEFGDSCLVRALWCVLLPYDHRAAMDGSERSVGIARTHSRFSLTLAFASSSAPSALITT